MAAKAIAIVEVPFHMGLQDVAVGRGPSQLVAAMEDAPEVVHIRKRDRTAEGLDAVVDVNRQVRYAVREAVEAERLPLVLSGNCNACLGTLAGLEGRRTGIVWLDAHPDFHTPESSRSGFLDGMALAAAIGHCQEELRERIGFLAPVREEDVLLLGVRDIEDGERERLAASQVTVRAYGRPLDDLPELLGAVAGRVEAVYLHVDVDCLDAAESPGVNYRGPGGFGVGETEQVLMMIAGRTPLAAAGLANYNPDRDIEGRTLSAALRLLRVLSGR
jgi:arginase